MKRKMSIADYDKAIIKKLDHILSLIKLIRTERRFYNSLYAAKK